jgi:eukaryotic-like serine/threonine-protein kinase
MPIGDFGHFALIEELGRGDLGIVYKARDLSQDRVVALKMLQAGARATGDDRRRFLNEARVAAWLDHPHIAQIYALGQIDVRCFIVMELIGGPSLARKPGEFVGDPQASARLVKTLAEAVHDAHQRETLHLDLKPSKVLIDESGEPHLIGFSLNKQFDANDGLMQSGAILGKPDYLAPEQASGRGGRVTTATDVYGLGAILYALITGRAPFAADSPAETLAKVRDAMPETPSRRQPWISRDLEVIVLKCLEKEPERRYSSAAALADDLGRNLNGEPIRASLSGWAT